MGVGGWGRLQRGHRLDEAMGGGLLATGHLN